MTAVVREVLSWALSLTLGYLVGTAIGAGVSTIVFPLGSDAIDFAVRDDLVSEGVRHVLQSRGERSISTTTVEGGTIAVAISGDRSAIAVAASSVRPSHTPEGRHQIVLLLWCDDEAVNLGPLGERFFAGPTREGWENSVAITVPENCTDLIIAVLDARAEVLSTSEIPLRDDTRPTGYLARAETA